MRFELLLNSKHVYHITKQYKYTKKQLSKGLLTGTILVQRENIIQY